MKKNIATLLLVLTLGANFLLPVVAAAQTSPGGVASNSSTGGGTISNPIGSGDIPTFLSNILTVVIQIGTMISVFFIIYAGFKYVTAGGDEKKISSAHQMLLWACVGAAILIGAQTIVNVLKNTVSQLSQ
jgi:hypothetical protein